MEHIHLHGDTKEGGGVNFQIGMVTSGAPEWETHPIGESDILTALKDKLGIEDGLARGSIEEAKKLGLIGIFVSKTHKIRVAG